MPLKYDVNNYFVNMVMATLVTKHNLQSLIKIVIK